MNRLLATLLLVVMLVSVTAGLARLAIRDAQGGETHPVYTPQRYDPWGTAALAEVLRARGVAVRQPERPRLPPDFKGVLLQVAPTPRLNTLFDAADSDPEAAPRPGVLAAAPLLDWVAQGNTLIHLTRHPTALTAALNLTEDDLAGRDAVARHQQAGGRPEDPPGTVVTARWSPGPAGAAPRRLALRNPLGFDNPQHPAWSTRLNDGSRILGGVQRHGAGRVVVLGAPTPVLNHPLSEADHLPWLLEQLGDGPVLIDGWSHGIGHAGGILETIARFGLIPLLIQGAVLLGAWRWASRRAPAPAPPPPPTPRHAREQIETLARLGGLTQTPPETARRTYDLVRERLAHGLRCQPRDVTARLRARRGPAAERAGRLLARAAALAATDRPRCSSCGQDVTATQIDTCSECGARLAPSLLRHARRPELTAAPLTADPAAPSGRPTLPTPAELLDTSAAIAQELRRA